MFVVSRSQRSKDLPLIQARDAAKATVNARIGEVRTRFITDIPGQEAVYAAKEAEARDFLALPSAPDDLAGFPFLEKEVGMTAPTATDLANLWVDLANQWRAVGSDLEQLRLGVSASLGAATNPDEIAAILAEMESYLDAIE